MMRSAGMVLVVSCLGACALSATHGTQAGVKPAQATAGERAVSPGFSPQTLYQLLLAEVAVQRGEYALASRQYKAAANETRDPRVIERAMRLAGFVQAKDDMRQLAGLWSREVPGAAEPHQVLTMLLLEQGDIDGAAVQLEQIYKIKPDFDYMQVSVMLARVPDKQVSSGVMTRFMKTRQNNPEALFAQAHFASRVGEFDQAQSILGRVMTLKPRWGQPLVLRSHLLQREGKQEEAQRLLASALAQGVDDDAMVRLAYGRLLSDAKQYEAAMAEFARLEQREPENTELLYVMGVTSAQLERYADAERYFKRVLAQGQRTNEVSFQLGQLMDLQRRDEEALVWYGRVAEGGLVVPAQMRMAAVLGNLKRVDEALTLLEAVEVDNMNDRLSVSLLRGELLLRAKRYQEALATYEEALGAAPEEERLLYAYSMAAERLGRIDLAEKALRSVLSREPNNATVLNALGYTLADRTDRYAEAHGFIEAALALRPDDAAVLDSMGWVLYKQGRFVEAIGYLRKAIAQGYDAEIAAHLGEVLWRSGSLDEAKAVWGEALNKAPGHEVVVETMKRFGQ